MKTILSFFIGCIITGSIAYYIYYQKFINLPVYKVYYQYNVFYHYTPHHFMPMCCDTIAWDTVYYLKSNHH